MIVEIGGQGTLVTSRILVPTIQAGYDVKLQKCMVWHKRGGSVVTFVRYGKVNEPIVEEARLMF